MFLALRIRWRLLWCRMMRYNCSIHAYIHQRCMTRVTDSSHNFSDLDSNSSNQKTDLDVSGVDR